MIVLAIDTATNDCAACLYDAHHGVVLAELTEDIGHGHAEHLLGLVDQVLVIAGRVFGDIDKIAVSIGPGSFTGIRVGVAAARGLGLALDKPVVGVSTLQAIAADCTLNVPFTVAVLAGRGQAYLQSFNTGGIAHTAPFLIKLDESSEGQIEPVYFKLVGNAATQIDGAKAVALLDRATGSIKTIASLGAKGEVDASPLYIRQADAKVASGFALPRKSERAG